MSSTTTFRHGQVVVVNVPFTGQGGAKPRPALVVSVDGFHRKLLDLIVCPISSQPRYYRKPGPGDHPLKGWRSAGLRHPSTARISNILAVEKKLVKRVLGRLQADDILRIEQGLREAFGLLAAAARPALRDGKPSVQRGREVQIRGGASS